MRPGYKYYVYNIKRQIKLNVNNFIDKMLII